MRTATSRSPLRAYRRGMLDGHPVGVIERRQQLRDLHGRLVFDFDRPRLAELVDRSRVAGLVDRPRLAELDDRIRSNNHRWEQWLGGGSDVGDHHRPGHLRWGSSLARRGLPRHGRLQRPR